MTFSHDQVWRVFLRLRDLEAKPRLFNDRMPGGRVRIRRERFRRWCGLLLWQILCNCEMKREPLRADQFAKWRRGGIYNSA